MSDGGGGDKGPTEIELKLSLPQGARALLEQHESFRAVPAEIHEQRTTYFDTADRRLAALGAVLRVRADGKSRRQTVKSAGDGAGLAAVRGEWEWQIGQDTPDLALLAETPALAAIVAAVGDAALEPVFASEITRTLRLIWLGGTCVEAAIDEGVVRAGAETLPVSELELELKEGEVAPLYRFALELHAGIPFTIVAETKAARGYRLAKGGAFAAHKASDVALDAAMSGAQVVRALVDGAVSDLLANLPGAAAGHIECTHQARVALRRLRTILVLFGPRLEPVATARVNEELRSLGQSLGMARDWDVFCEEVLPSVGEHTAEPRVLDLLREAATAARRRAHADASAMLQGSRLTATILGLSSWVAEGAAAPSLLGGADLGKPAHGLLSDLLDRLARKVAERGRKIETLPDDQLHALRKSLKKLRYAVDDVATLFKRKRVDRYRETFQESLALLGSVNDAVTGIEMACRLCEDGRADLTPGLAALSRWGQGRERKARRKLLVAFTRVGKAKPFW